MQDRFGRKIVRMHRDSIADWPAALDTVPGRFMLLAIADWRVSDEAIEQMAERSILQGLAGLIAWGPDCRASIAFDFASARMLGDPTYNPKPMMSTDIESLGDAIWDACMIDIYTPDEWKEETKTLLIATLGPRELIELVDRELAEWWEPERPNSPRAEDLTIWSPPLARLPIPTSDPRDAEAEAPRSFGLINQHHPTPRTLRCHYPRSG